MNDPGTDPPYNTDNDLTIVEFKQDDIQNAFDRISPFELDSEMPMTSIIPVIQAMPIMAAAPRLGQINGASIGAEGVIDNTNIQEPEYMMADMRLLPDHRVIIDELFVKYRDGNLKVWMIEYVQKRLRAEIVKYETRTKVAIRMQLSMLLSSCRVKSLQKRHDRISAINRI